ncbi:MAG: OmpA family protein [Sulfurovaceae bacterium]|nr:OmpA family protein [Sulfurovaceae bacterium]
MTKKIKTSLIASSVAVMLLGGCAEQGLVADDSYTRTKTGAVTGAIGGAILGAATGNHSGKRALIGALIGGAVGAGVGYSLDQQANAVARALGTGVSNDPLAELDPNREIIVTKTDTYVKITFRDSMMFAVDSATPRATAQSKINKVGTVLQKYPQTIVQVAGFTDNTGGYDYNQGLSEKRADNVANVFENAGASNVSAVGCSYSAPVVPNTTASNKSLNRRVEVYLYPNEDAQIDPCRQ